MNNFKSGMFVTYKDSIKMVLVSNELVKIVDLDTDVKLMVKPENLVAITTVPDAVKVHYRSAEYLVTNQEKIVSCTSGKVMKWAKDHPIHVQIMELVKNYEFYVEGKPPLGVMPKNLWIEQRIKALDEAIERYYNSATHSVPREWVKEVQELRLMHRQL